MARKRMIDPGIWQSEDFSRLSTLAKLVFIGMFSNADDEGRGRAKAIYLRSILFPYDEGLRVIDIEKALSEIGSNMSVTMYEHDGNQYYQLDNWSKWQRVDKPSPSQIPAFDGTPLPFGDDSGSIRGAVPPKKIEENRSEVKGKEENVSRATRAKPSRTTFVPPSLDEVKEYCKSRGNRVDAQRFFDYFDTSGWVDSKGAPVRNWKQKAITWEQGQPATGAAPGATTRQSKPVAAQNYSQREYTDDELGKLVNNILETEGAKNGDG